MESRIILFDLGGVLIEVVSVQKLSERMPSYTTNEIARLWSNSKWLDLFESGGCDRETFSHEIVRELGLHLSPEIFMKEFCLFLKGFYPGAEKLLKKLSRSPHILACLTDTNPSQWNHLCRRTSINQYFTNCFLSYQIGKRKPDPEVYRAVLDSFACDPKKILYFDDRDQNVEAGRKVGMEAYRVEGVSELEYKLKELNLL